MDTNVKSNLPKAEAPSLEGSNAAPHVALDDVDSYMELAASGLVPVEIGACGAVQNSIGLGERTRGPLRAS